MSNNTQNFAFLVLFLGFPAASLGADLASQLAACRAVEDCAERMACYDAITLDGADAAAPAPQSLPAPDAQPAAAPSPAVRPVATPSPEELFGKSAAEAQRSISTSAGNAPLDELEATITDLREIARERVLVTLDNGQHWRQTAHSSLILSVGDQIVIRPASMGSYKLTKGDGKRTMRVQRVD